jgi:TonB family protein
LSSAGGTGGVTLDVADFCCPGYITDMVTIIRQNWQQKQGIVGVTTMRFTIARNGTIESPQLEKSSGFEVLDTAARRALLLTRLPQLPREYPNQTLTVHLQFDFSQ